MIRAQRSEKTLGDRMKEYEAVSERYLIRRTPVIIRLDGKAFHTYTKGIESQYKDTRLREVMQETTKFLVEGIQGAVLGYHQSDEISILLKDWTDINTDSWYGNRQNKIESISASMCSVHFNKLIRERFAPDHKLYNTDAYFDSRAFNVPKEDVCNYFVWRQKDMERNSVQSYAREFYSHKRLHGVPNEVIKNKLRIEHDSPWESLHPYLKGGFFYKKTPGGYEEFDTILTQNRNLVEDLL